MPSIFTHLILAEDAMQALPFGPLRAALEADSRAYFLGCLAPDLPYFDMFQAWRGLPLGSYISPVTHSLEGRVLAWLGWSLPEADGWSGRLHGSGTEGVLRGWNAWAACRPGALRAFTAGMLTHWCADEVLHPKVVADASDYGDAEGKRRHRELEIALDLVLLRARGVALEGLDLDGLLETFIGRVDRRGEHLSPELKHDWLAASAACDGVTGLRRAKVDQWSRGFSDAMRLLGHPLSPVLRARRNFQGGAEERWRTHFARELYLASHVPRAARAAETALRRSPLGEALGTASLV